MTVPTLETVLAYAAKVARDAFKVRHEVRPMWAGHTADGELVMVVPEKFGNAADKQFAVDQVRAIFKEKKVVMFTFMTEAWMVDSKSTTPQSISRLMRTREGLADHPDRREVVQIIAEDRERSIMGMYFILRPEHGKPTLSPFRKQESMETSGRMTGLLREQT